VEEAAGRDRGHIDIRLGGMGEQHRKLLGERGALSPRVKPEGGRDAIINMNSSERPESRKTSDNATPDGSDPRAKIPEVGAGGPTIPAPKPASPRDGGIRMELGKELGEKGRVLSRNREDPEPADTFWGADNVPRDLALAAGAVIVAIPKEGTPSFINSLNDSRREKSSAHGMSEHGREDRVDKDKPPTNGEGPTTPTGQFHITLGNDRSKVRIPNFVSGEGEAKVGLRKGGHNTTERGRNGRGRRGLHFDGNKGAFVIVNVEASGVRKVCQEFFEIGRVLRDSPNDYESIVGILQDRARKVINKWVKEQSLPRGAQEELLQDVSHNVEEKGGEGVSLTKAALTLDPAPGDTIQENRGLTGLVY
jgi:hypothetical protein